MRVREWIAAAAGTAAVGTAIFALGSTPRWAQAAVAGLVAIAAISQVWSRKTPARIPVLLVVIGIAIGLTILQLVPVGHAVVNALNSTGATLRADGAAIAGVSPPNTLTFDVPGSLSSLAFFLTLLAVATVSLRIAVTERGRFGLLAVVAGMCGLTAAVVGLQALFDSPDLYGVYEPLHASPRVMGPLLNDNQLGCLMALGAVVSGGLVMYRRQPPWVRVLWIVIAGGCAVVALATLSRGAAIALGSGAVVLVATLVGQRVTKDNSRSGGGRLTNGSVQIGIVAICAVVMVVYASSGGVAKQLEGTSMSELENPRSKFVAWRNAADLVEESPWAGWGRGAFEAAFTRVHPTSGLATFSYLENEYLQTVVDWGIPGALLIGLAGVWLAMKAFSRWRGGPLAAGGLAGLTVVALQSNVDFGVEFLGLAIPITIVAATLTYVPMRQPGTRTVLMARAIRAIHVFAILAGAAVLLSAATTTVEEDHDDTIDTTDVDLASLRDSLERHPLDYRGYLLEAVVLARNHHVQQAIEVLNHALELHPTHSGLHLFLGELLRETGNLDQATVEYASALRSSTSSARTISEIVERLPSPVLIARSIPPDYYRFYDVMGVLEHEHRYDVAIDWLQLVLATGSDNLRTCAALYQLAARSKQLDAIAIATESCPQYSPTPQIKRYLAKNALDAHDPKTALRLLTDLETWTGNVTDKFEAWLTRCDSFLALDDLDNAEQCLHRLDATGYAPKHEIIDRHLDAIASARLAHDASANGSLLRRWLAPVLPTPAPHRFVLPPPPPTPSSILTPKPKGPALPLSQQPLDIQQLSGSGAGSAR